MDIRAEERLIEIGQQWLKRGGVRGMKLRRICAEAELSPGTFTAYFPTLGEFKKKVLDNWYTPLQTEVNRIEKIEGNAKERLRTILLAVMRFFRPNARGDDTTAVGCKCGGTGCQRFFTEAAR